MTTESTTPSRFRKRPVVVEAMRWDGSVEEATVVIDWILATGTRSATYRCDGADGCPGTVGAHYVAVETLEGTMLASPGDWIIRGVQGEHYPCKPDNFEQTYEPADPTRPTGDQSGSHAPVQGLDAACAWADYRKDYGASANPDVLRREHKAFLAGWQAARGTLDIGGVQR